jgi:hypothetical protein
MGETSSTDSTAFQVFGMSGASKPSNHRLERAVTGGGGRAASALRDVALASRWMRLRPAA